ncbi:hypothetical protein AHF37_05094, partial [Paragonimus kellicotti]
PSPFANVKFFGNRTHKIFVKQNANSDVVRLFPDMNRFKLGLSDFLFVSIHIFLFIMLCSQSNNPKNVLRLKNSGLLRTSTIPSVFDEHSYTVRQDASDPDWLLLETWILLSCSLPLFYLSFSWLVRIILPNNYRKLEQIMRIVFCLVFLLYYVGLALVVDLFILIGLGVLLGFLFHRRQLFIWLFFCGILGYSNDCCTLPCSRSHPLAHLALYSLPSWAADLLVYILVRGSVIDLPQCLDVWVVDSWRARGLVINNGVLCFAGFVSAIHFYFLHLLFYGIPAVFADLEQFLMGGDRSVPKDFQMVSCAERHPEVNTPSCVRSQSFTVSKTAQLCLVPAPPSCVYHIVLFSEMWRTFDRGLYGFILRHIYLPLRGAFNSDSNNLKFFRSVLGFASPFLFVLLFHSINQGNCVWAAFNLFQVASERTVKRLQQHSKLGAMLVITVHFFSV